MLLKNIKKFLVLLFIMFAITGTGPIQKVYADDAPDYVFKVENPSIQHAYFNIFNAIKILFASPAQDQDGLTENSTWKTYTGLLKLVFVLSGFFIFAEGIIKIFGGGEAAAKSAIASYIRYILLGFTLIFILYSWKASVAIDGYAPDNFCTSTTTDAHFYDIVDDFPGALAFMYTFINKVGEETSNLVQTVYAPSSEFVTTKNYGYMGALKANMHLLGIDINDVPYYQDDNSSTTAKADLGNRYGALIAQCILIPFSACENGMNYINEIKQTKNIYGFLDDLYNTNPVICNNIKAGDYKLEYSGETLNCGDFWSNISTLTTKWKEVLGCAFPDLTKGGIALFSSSLATPQVSDLQSIALQAGLVSQLQKTYSNLGLGVNGIGYAAGKSKAEFVQSNLASGAYMSEMLPVLQMVIRALLYAFFPFVFVVILLPGGMSVLKQYLQSILWIELWTPTAGILNMFMLDYAQGRLQQQYDTNGINSYNITYYLSNDSTIAGVAGYLYLAVPALTWLILKGSGYMLGNITGAVGATMAKNIQTQSINQDTAELKKYQEFASKTPGYVSMAEMSHYEAIQKGAISGGHLAGTKSIDIETQAHGAYAGSYIATAKNAGTAISQFDRISKKANGSVSSASFRAGSLEGITSGANLAEKANTMTEAEADVLGTDAVVNEKYTAQGKFSSKAYSKKGKLSAKGGEFDLYSAGITEQVDVSMNDTMSKGMKRNKLEKEGLLDYAHKARQLDGAINEYLGARGNIENKRQLEESKKGQYLRENGFIKSFNLDSKLQNKLIQGEANNLAAKMFSGRLKAAESGITNSVDYALNDAAVGGISNMINQEKGNILRNVFGDYLDEKTISSNELKNIRKNLGLENKSKDNKVVDFSKKLEEMKKNNKFQNAKLMLQEEDTANGASMVGYFAKDNFGLTDEEASKLGTLTSRSLNKLSNYLNKGIKHHDFEKVKLATAALATNLAAGKYEKDELEQVNNMITKGSNFLNKTIKTLQTAKDANISQAGKDINRTQTAKDTNISQAGENANISQAESEKENTFIKNKKNYSAKDLTEGLAKADVDTMIGKAIGTKENLAKDPNMYMKNAQAQEMASQQVMAQKIDAQGGIQGYVGIQSLAARLAANAQQGQIEGQTKQLLKEAGFSDKDAQKLLDSFKKGADELRKAGDDFVNKLKGALGSLDNLSKTQADFQAQKKQAVANKELDEASKQGVYDTSKGTLTSLGEEAYGAQGSTQVDKNIGAFTQSAKKAQEKGLELMLQQKIADVKKRALRQRNRILSNKEAKEIAIKEMAPYIKNVDRNGKVTFKTGAELKNAEALMSQRNMSLTTEDGNAANLNLGTMDTGGRISGGLSFSYDDSYNRKTGDYMYFDPATTLAMETPGGTLAAMGVKSLPFAGRVFNAGGNMIFGRRNFRRMRKPFENGIIGTRENPGVARRGVAKIRRNMAMRSLAREIRGPHTISAGTMTSFMSSKFQGVKVLGEFSPAAGKVISKGTSFLAKRVPGVGTALEFMDATSRFERGDYIGAAISATAGLITNVPVIGTAGGIILDGINIGKDFLFSSSSTTKERGNFHHPRARF